MALADTYAYQVEFDGSMCVGQYMRHKTNNMGTTEQIPPNHPLKINMNNYTSFGCYSSGTWYASGLNNISKSKPSAMYHRFWCWVPPAYPTNASCAGTG